MNAKMPDLKRAFEAAGFTEVRTVLSSGNVVFSTRATAERTLERRAEAAMEQTLGRSFFTIVRSVDALQQLLASDPFRAYRLKPGAKRVVTFLRQPPAGKVALPGELEGARIYGVKGAEVFTAYVRNPKGNPVFMTLIDKTFGKDQTTRTWDTVAKIAR